MPPLTARRIAVVAALIAMVAAGVALLVVEPTASRIREWLSPEPPTATPSAPRPLAPVAGHERPPARVAYQIQPGLQAPPPAAATERPSAIEPGTAAETTSAQVGTDFTETAGLVTTLEDLDLWKEHEGRQVHGSVQPGTLLEVFGGVDGVQLVRDEAGSEGWVPSCLLTSKPAEVAVARAMALARRHDAASRPEEAEAERARARAANPGARLLAVMDGGPLPDPPCFGMPPPRNKEVREHDGVARVVGTLTLLGPFYPDSREVQPPWSVRWEDLARRYFVDGPPDAPLGREARLEAREQARRDASAVAEETMTTPPPSFEYAIPGDEMKPGHIYVVRVEGVEEHSARLVGNVYPSMDCDGCEVGPRSHRGHLRLSPSMRGGGMGFVVWSREPVQFQTVAVPSESIRVVGRMVELVLPDGGKVTGTTEPGRITEAAIVSVSPGDVRMLVVNVLDPPICERGARLFRIGETLEIVEGAATDCDL